MLSVFLITSLGSGDEWNSYENFKHVKNETQKSCNHVVSEYYK